MLDTRRRKGGQFNSRLQVSRCLLPIDDEDERALDADQVKVDHLRSRNLPNWSASYKVKLDRNTIGNR